MDKISELQIKIKKANKAMVRCLARGDFFGAIEYQKMAAYAYEDIQKLRGFWGILAKGD